MLIEQYIKQKHKEGFYYGEIVELIHKEKGIEYKKALKIISNYI